MGKGTGLDLTHFRLCYAQTHQEGGVGKVSYPRSHDVWGAPSSLKNMKYTRMHHFIKKNSKFFSPKRPREIVWGARKNVAPGPAFALDGPAMLKYLWTSSSDMHLTLRHKIWYL